MFDARCTVEFVTDQIPATLKANETLLDSLILYQHAFSVEYFNIVAYNLENCFELKYI